MLPLRGLARIPDETPGSRQKSPHSSEESPTLRFSGGGH